MNCREAQEQRKMFHYAWLLFLIILVAWELPKDIQFPSVVLDLLEAVKYASLWVTKDEKQIKERNILEY